MNPGRPILAEYARFGWFLVEIPPGKKGPVIDRWNLKEMCISDPDVAEWMHGNVGLAHAYSGTCAIDIDDMARTVDWMKGKGIDLPSLLNAPDAVRIESRAGRGKLLYRISKPLPTFKLSGAFELRCASGNGLTMQDVLPPSIHPDTGKPYTWKYNAPGAHWSKLPPLPPSLAALWASFIRPPAAKPTPGKRKAEPINAAALRASLALWDPDVSYDDWIMIGMALHFETRGSDEGLGLWNEWSARGKKYKGLADLDFHWRSFRHDHQTPKTLASLRKETAATADEFPDLTKPQRPVARTPAIPLPSQHKRDMAEEIIRSLSKTKLGKYEAKISNVTSILGLSELSGHELALDVFLDMIVVMDNNSKQWRPLTDTDYTALRIWLETIGNCEPITHDMMRQAVHLVAEQQQFDSAQAWLGGIQWDGKKRINEFCSRYFGTEHTQYTSRVGEYLWTALAGRVMNPGCQADMVPVLIGPQGIGKLETARAVAGLAMGGYEDNILMNRIFAGNHPDVYIIERKPDLSEISIEQIRDLISRMQLRPFEASIKVCIIKNVDELSIEGANALLKTLEEPTPNSLLILTTAVVERNLGTIRSRCQAVYFFPLSKDKLAARIKKDYAIGDSATRFLALFSEGNPGRAGRLKEDNFLARKNELINNILFEKNNDAFLKEILSDKECTRQMLDVLLSWFRDVLLMKAGNEEDNTIHADRLGDIRQAASRYSFEELESIVEQIVTTTQLLGENLNVKVPLSLLRERIWVRSLR